jgi:hypothetical protein
MLSEKQLELINKIASKETFKYVGELIPNADPTADIDYKFRVTSYKKMISVGEYYDYLKVEVTIVGLNDYLSRIVFGFDEVNKHLNLHNMFKTQLYPFYNKLNFSIRDYLQSFDTNVRVTIDDLKFDLGEVKPITESRMSRIAVRTTVKDILNIIKNNEPGEFYLPGEDGEEYSFTNLPFTYSVELYVEIDNNLDGYSIGGNFSSEDDVIEITIKFNPKTLRKNIYNIIGELNDIVAHELEHGFQYMTEGKVYQEPPSDSLGYYTQPDEIKSQRVGLRRLAKLRKLPFNDVVSEWFDTHRDIHGLTENEQEIVINEILVG